MPDLIGKTFGQYRIISQIGLGGMATVFEAYQPSMDRYVALKVLSTYLTEDPAFIKRFQQEAKIIAQLEHLHILPVYDHGEQDGYLYLAKGLGYARQRCFAPSALSMTIFANSAALEGQRGNRCDM